MPLKLAITNEADLNATTYINLTQFFFHKDHTIRGDYASIAPLDWPNLLRQVSKSLFPRAEVIVFLC